MPARYFAPVNGFADKNVSSIRVETIDGHAQSVEIHADGSERNLGAVGFQNIWVATWSLKELETMVSEGKWKEVDGPSAPEPVRQETPVEAPAEKHDHDDLT